MRIALCEYGGGGDGVVVTALHSSLGLGWSINLRIRFAFRHILDLNVLADCPNETFAAELANKLCEEKDELMCKFVTAIKCVRMIHISISQFAVRVVNVLGKEIPTKLFKETQKIEADGGMLIMVFYQSSSVE